MILPSARHTWPGRAPWRMSSAQDCRVMPLALRPSAEIAFSRVLPRTSRHSATSSGRAALYSSAIVVTVVVRPNGRWASAPPQGVRCRPRVGRLARIQCGCNSSRIHGSHLQEGSRWTLRLSPPLFPILESRYAHTDHKSKLRLRLVEHSSNCLHVFRSYLELTRRLLFPALDTSCLLDTGKHLLKIRVLHFKSSSMTFFSCLS